jgi:hypothetical protein
VGSHVQRTLERRGREMAAALSVVVCCLLLAACGGSSASTSGASTTASTASTSSTATTGSTAPSKSTSSTSKSPAGKQKSAKKSKPGEHLKPIKAPALPKVTGPLAARVEAIRACMRRNGVVEKPGERGLPAGVSKAHFRAAITKCEAAAEASSKAGESAASEALKKFSSCLRKHGVGGSSGVSVSSAAGKAALQKCKGDLAGALGVIGSGGGATGSTGG